MLSDAEIKDRLWGPYSGGSDVRAYVLTDMLFRAETDDEFWRIFQFGWPTSDNTWYCRRDIKMLLDEREPAGPFLKGADKEFYDSLPDLVTVYRGCSSSRVRGLAWTTDLDIARRFARGHRQIDVPSPVVATANVPKEAIYTVTTDRNEFEVVLNWRRLRNLKTEPYGSA